MGPERRVSLPMTKRDWVAPSRRRRIPAALPNLKAISGVMGYRFAVPRMPSVPNSLRPDMMMIGCFLEFTFWETWLRGSRQSELIRLSLPVGDYARELDLGFDE